MNRDLKFRAWDKIENIMHYQENGNEGVEFSFGGTNCVRVYEYKPQLIDGVCIDDYDYDELEDYELMQYTGLRDKNGKEIYDGDIITFTEIDEDSCMGKENTYTGKVEWIDEIAQWRFIYPSGQRTELHFIVQLPTIISCEVIGNIYENPELLLDKN